MDKSSEWNPFEPPTVSDAIGKGNLAPKQRWIARVIVALLCAMPALILLPLVVWLLSLSLIQTLLDPDIEGLLILLISGAGTVGVAGTWSFVIFGKLKRGSEFQIAAMAFGTAAFIVALCVQSWNSPGGIQSSFLLPFLSIPLGGAVGVGSLLKP